MGGGKIVQRGTTVAGVTRSRGRPRHPDVLTPTEWRVADLVRHGLSRRQIAERSGVSLDAVKYHLQNISQKLGIDGGVQELRRWPGIPVSSPLTGSARGEPMPDPTTLTSVGQIALYVTSVDDTERFYRDVLGLPHLYTFGDLAFFDCGGIRLYLHAVDPEKWVAGSVVYFRVGDIHATYERLLAEGVHWNGAPHLIHRHDDGTEEWMAFFTDPAGNTLALMSQVRHHPPDDPAISP
jgi:catechol 2,3-dioxygenase-like lactoylglutathione lyase family enzyme/DNA-binding CsgD family transcriptional regulator